MGELFRQIRPETPFPWTGERMVPGLTGPIEAEHFHRYFLARELCRGKDVLDVACGEGYGSAFLAQTAHKVVGVELDPATVEHATREYCSDNLRFLQGEATKLPIPDNSVDAVVSFETIEHISDHKTFFAEVKRVLRPDGFLIISTPDVNVYSALGTPSNPFHVREMTEDEFRAKLGAAFRTVSLLRQRAMTGSAILPDALDDQTTEMSIYEQRDSNTFESDRKLLRAPFLLAVASDGAVPHVGVSLYISIPDTPHEVKALLAELDRLRLLEESVREQAPIVDKAMGDAAVLPVIEAELARLRNTDIPALQAELERLRGVEATARDQAPIFTKAMSDAASAQDEAIRLQEQLNASTLTAGQQALLARQHALAAQRAQREMVSVRNELLSATNELLSVREEMFSVKTEADAYRSAYQQAAGLIVPLRLRQSLPEPVKRLFRMLKRTGP